MGKSTLDMMDKILGEDRTAAAAQKKKIAKGEGYCGPIGDIGESLTIKKADAGGMILCWYGPNGSRDVIVKDAAEATPLIEKFFADHDSDKD